MWRSGKSESRSLKVSNSSVQRSRWRCLPGSLANDSRMPSFGAPASCLSVPSLQCAPSPSPQQKQLKIFEARERMLDALRGVALSSIKVRAIQQPFLSRESQKLCRHSPEADRPGLGPPFAEGEYEAQNASPGDALQS